MTIGRLVFRIVCVLCQTFVANQSRLIRIKRTGNFKSTFDTATYSLHLRM